MKTLIVIVLLLIPVSVHCAVEWWQKAVIYQIYPRSFKDSNGDGIGDLKGITQGMEHVKDAGADAIWLSPIFKSPMYDFGYDISNFKEIQPEYGTMQDFDDLMTEAKRLGIYIILDFVPNHGSNESDWFDLSANRTSGYENYFVWQDGRINASDPDNLLPPNNWVSVFRKSAWEYNKVRKQYYLHQFAIGQPDLNYREPKVVAEMKDVLRFWLDRGVAGFRMDAVPHIFEVDTNDYGGVFPDEPLTHDYGANPDDYNYLYHIYTTGQEPTYDMIYQWRALLDQYKRRDNFPRVILTEAYADIKLTMRYYGNATDEGANLPFNFYLLVELNKNSDARDIKFAIDKWLTYMPGGKTANWVNGNHDQSRMATRHGVERADSMNMIALMLPGTALTYQGEELAMTDGFVSWEDTKDPQACNTDDPVNYLKSSRDPQRTPFHWDDSTNAGFTTGSTTWLPVASNYREVNLKAQINAEKSHYKFYQDLTALKKTDVLAEGGTEIKTLSKDILIILRYLGEDHVVGIVNLSDQSQTIDLRTVHNLPKTMSVYSSGIASSLAKGALIETSSFTITPHSAVVLKNGARLMQTMGILQIFALYLFHKWI